MIARQGFDYLLVSGTCMILHNAVMIVADGYGLALPLAVLASFLIVALTGYALHSRISFHRPMNLAALLRYLLAMSANIPLAIATTWLWLVPARLPMALAAPLGALCMVAVNYALSRWAIDRRGMAGRGAR